MIEEQIFHFPHQWFYILTDKGFYFTLHSKKRPFTDKETDKLNSIRETIFSIRSTPHFQKALDNFKNSKEFYNNGMEDVARLIFRADKYAGILTSYNDSKIELNELIEELEKRSNKEKYYTLAPHEIKRQIKIYISKNQSLTFEKLGYKVQSMTSTETEKTWNEEFMNYDFNEISVEHYYIQIDRKVFSSACKNGVLLPSGQYIDENGIEVELKKGRTKGCNNDHLKNKIILMSTETWNELIFESQNELALEFNVKKSNLSRKLKGLKIGDCIKFNKIKYVIKEI